jgi:hypothetical protein
MRTCRLLWVLVFAFWLVLAAGLSAGGQGPVQLRGTFGGEIESTPSEFGNLSQLYFSLGVRGQGWSTSVRATFADDDFLNLSLSDDRKFGPLSLRSVLTFDPDAGKFTYASNLARFNLLDLRVANYLYLPADQSRAYDQVTIDGAVGSVGWRSDVRVDLCTGEFRALSAQANWVWDPCGVEIDTLVSFNRTDGFESFQLSARYPEVPWLSFGSLVTDALLTLDFKVKGKSVLPELLMRVAQSSLCLTPMLALELGDAPLSVAGVQVYGLKLECSVDQMVELYAATSLMPEKNYELTGYSDFYEVYRLSLVYPSCCGQEPRIEVACYFDKTAGELFDCAMMAASIEIPLADSSLWTVTVERGATDWLFRVGWEMRF